MTPGDQEWTVATVAAECPSCGTLWLRRLTWLTRGKADARTACCGARLQAWPERIAAVFVATGQRERRG